jgi:hypothetical protein
MLRRMSLLALAVVLVLGSAGIASADLTWNFANEWSDTNNSGTWRSGYLSGPNGDFNPFVSTGSACAGAVHYWYDSTSGGDSLGVISKNVTGSPQDEAGTNYWEPGQTVIMTGWSSWNEVRWFAPQNDTYYVTAHFTNQKIDGRALNALVRVGDGYSNVIFEDQLTGFNGRAVNGYADRTPDAHTYSDFVSGPITLTAGQTIGFVNKHAYYALAQLGVDITITTPEPSAIVLLGTAFIGLLAYAWRKRR